MNILRILNAVPGSPSNLQGEAVSPTAIQLEWEPASMIDATLESYVLYYNDPAVHQNIRVNISPPQNSYLLTDLTPNTLYNIRVTGKSAAGEGISSATIVVRTFEYGELDFLVVNAVLFFCGF